MLFRSASPDMSPPSSPSGAASPSPHADDDLGRGGSSGASSGENNDDDASDDLVSPPAEPRTRLQKGIKQPKQYTDGTIRYGMFTSTGEPSTLAEALEDTRWRQAMQEEYNALMDNKTWHLVPPSSTRNLIDCKWVYRVNKNADGSIKHVWLQKVLNKDRKSVV